MMQIHHLKENKNHNLIPVLREINLILHNKKDTDNHRMDMDHNEDIHHKDNRCMDNHMDNRCTDNHTANHMANHTDNPMDNHTDNQCTVNQCTDNQRMNNKEAEDSVVEV
jgi:hypothetical protein